MIKIGIVGFGFIAQNGHTPFYINNPDIVVVGVTDPCQARLFEAAKIFPNAKCFRTVDKMLKCLKGQIDIVDICTPPYAHFNIISKTINSGLHVICEKPLVIDKDQIDYLINLSQKKGLVIYPCHNYHFSPIVQMAKNFIQEKYIGIPQKVILHTYRTSHALGVKEWFPNWRRYKKYSGGGILMDHGPHSSYIVHELLGKPNPLEVSCVKGNLRNKNYKTEDTAHLEISFIDGKHATILLSWASAYRQTRYLVIGTSGYLELDDDKIILHNNGKSITQDTQAKFNDPSHSNWFGPMFWDFQQKIFATELSIRQSALLEARMVLEIIQSAYLSSENGGQLVSI